MTRVCKPVVLCLLKYRTIAACANIVELLKVCRRADIGTMKSKLFLTLYNKWDIFTLWDFSSISDLKKI